MKKFSIVRLIALVAIFVGLGINTLVAQNVLPIQSQAVLREYALSKVTHGSRSVWSDSMVWDDNSVTSSRMIGNGAEDVLDKLFAVEFKYRLANIADKIQGNVWLYDDQDHLIFYGRAEYTLADLAKGLPEYGIWLQDVPILSNVENAEVLVLSEDGYTVRREQLNVVDGSVMFRSWMSGSPNGILSIRFMDNTVATYNLWSPDGGTPVMNQETLHPSWKIEGHYLFDGDGSGKTMVKIIETYQNPTVFLRFKAGNSVTFDVGGIVQDGNNVTLERPISIVVTSLEGKTVKFPYGYEMILAPGQYRIRFEWKSFGKPGRLYDGPDDGDGKG